MEYVAPDFNKTAFHCPLCGAYAHMNKMPLITPAKGHTNFHQFSCSHCGQASAWRGFSKQIAPGKNGYTGEMIYPDVNAAPLPESDMPEDVKVDYLEASRIFSRSPRGAAALLRLGLQKLMIHLGEKGENINNDIRALADKAVLPPMVIKVADTVRLTGNNAVHPGEMSDEDFDYVAAKLFDLLNFIVRKGISEPAELEELYQKTPERKRQAAEEQDKRASGE